MTQIVLMTQVMEIYSLPTTKGGKYHFDIISNPFEISNNSMTYKNSNICKNGSNEIFKI